MTHFLKQLSRLPRYTVAVALLVLALMVYALAKGDPLGYILATVLVLFIGLPAVVIWALSRRDARRARAAHAHGDADPLTWPHAQPPTE
ncbi:MAG TPA: hypothetical protein VFY89_02060 [Ktedonobacterales bacterium]